MDSAVRAHAGNLDELLERIAFFGGPKPEQDVRILADGSGSAA
jgi:hypothetical protein